MCSSPLRPLLRIGTPDSPRARSRCIADLLAPHLPPTTRLELTPLPPSSFHDLQSALRANVIDLAIHSAEDIPLDTSAFSSSDQKLKITATPPRSLCNDLWLGHPLSTLPPNSRVAVPSLLRQAQLLTRRSDITCIITNYDITRILDDINHGQLHAAIVPAADHPRPLGALLPTDEFIPPAGQGTLALQTRADEPALLELLAKIHDSQTWASLRFERRIVRALTGKVPAPLGVCAQPRGVCDPGGQGQSATPQGVLRAQVPGVLMDPGWIVRAFFATPDASLVARATLLTQNPSDGGLYSLADPLLSTLKSRGSEDIMSRLNDPALS